MDSVSKDAEGEITPNVEESPVETGRRLYEFAVTQSNLNYFQRHVGRYARHTWSQISHALGDIGAAGFRIISALEIFGGVVLCEVRGLVNEVRSLPETTQQLWRDGNFLIPLYNFHQSYIYTFTIRKEFLQAWRHSWKHARRLYFSQWGHWFKIYMGCISCLVFFTLYHYRWRPWPRHRVKDELPCLHRTVVITGSSSGIGYRLAYEFIKRGAFVIVTSPDMVKARKARLDISRKLTTYIEKKRVRFLDEARVRYLDQIELPYELDIEFLLQNLLEMELNLASTSSIYSFTRKVQGMCPEGIDILINNAGVKVPPEELVITEEGKEVHFAVNYFGHFMLTNLLLSSLSKRKGSRIINVTCKKAVMHGSINVTEFVYPYLEEDGIPKLPDQYGYENSKLALHLFNGQLSKELRLSKIHNVTTYAVCPGSTRTHLDRRITYPSKLRKYWNGLKSCFYKKEFQAVQTILHCSLSPNVDQESGFFYENNAKSTISLRQLHIDKVAEELWNHSKALMAVGHEHMLDLTKHMHVMSHENIFQISKELFLHRRDVMTHLLLTEEKYMFLKKHKMKPDEHGDTRGDFTHFWNGFYLTGGQNSGLVERWVLYNSHPGFRALQQEYDVWYECTRSARFNPESSGKMAPLQFMASMPAALTVDDIVQLEKLYESDLESDGDVGESYYPDYVRLEALI